jgi:hypothetical protein
MRFALFTLLFTFVTTQSASALTVQPYGHDKPVKLDGPNFVAREMPSGCAIQGVYYDAENEYVVYKERMLYRHRCGVPADVIEEWANDTGADRFYERKIEDRYECHSRNLPSYAQ